MLLEWRLSDTGRPRIKMETQTRFLNSMRTSSPVWQHNGMPTRISRLRPESPSSLPMVSEQMCYAPSKLFRNVSVSVVTRRLIRRLESVGTKDSESRPQSVWYRCDILVHWLVARFYRITLWCRKTEKNTILVAWNFKVWDQFLG